MPLITNNLNDRKSKNGKILRHFHKVGQQLYVKEIFKALGCIENKFETEV